MERVDRIIRNEIFLENLRKNEAAEVDRPFCRHAMVHFLDVCRLAWIFVLEEGLDLSKDVVYAAGLLHDIGKHRQYLDGTPHEIASSEIAPKILEECGYSEKETAVIISAISTHRDASIAQNRDLNGILYRADKKSRSCFDCKAEAECNWKGDKKNFSVY